MSSESATVTIVKGERVSYPTGRGGRSEAQGRVVNIADGMATIETENGKLINRRLAGLKKLD